jgi:transglutaminase-like putative cysteine protease
MLAVGAYTHYATMVLRRRGFGVAASAALSFGGYLLLGSWLWFLDTTLALIPTSRTLDALSTELDASWAAFRELAAPVPAQPGFLIASSLALFFAIFLADWAAFRLWSPVEAVVPATTLFVFCALLGADQNRTSSAVVFGGAVLFFLLAHRVARVESQSGWLTADVERGSRWLLRTGVAIGVVAVIGGAVLGPNLPGASESPLVDWRGEQGGSPSRVTISPLVDIRQRLTEQTDSEVFTVESETPAYWRLTALDTFDGQVWRSGGRYSRAEGQLPAEVPAGIAVTPLTQTYSITGLAALWLPAAYQPVAIDTDAGVRYQAESSTLIVDTDYPNSDDFTYQVTSDVPVLTADELDRPGEVPPAELQGYLELPGSFSSDVRIVAEQINFRSGAQTPFQRAKALQDFFRDEGVFADDAYQFVYDLEATPAGHSGDAIEQFLASGRGFCEQFAGTYAALARSIGLPARVAVGFTWGEQDPADPNLYRVRGRFAHAWPEVWLGSEVGWVSFEPTPGRGAPGMDGYADVVPSQDDGTGSPATSTTATTSTIVDPNTPDATQPDPGAVTTDSLPDVTTTVPAGDSPSPVREPFAYATANPAHALLALLAVGLTYVALVTGVSAWRHRRRRRHATDPDARVQLSWQELIEELGLFGVTPRPSETSSEFAARAAAALPDRAADIAMLAADTDAARFAPTHLDDAVADRADVVVEQVSSTVQLYVPRHRRLLHRLDPRPLLVRPARAPRREAISSKR